MVTLNPGRFTAYEFANKVYKVDVPFGHQMEHILQPEYWMHVARYLNSGDEVIAVAEDNSYRAHLFVTTKTTTAVKMAVVNFTELSKEFEVPADADTSYVIEWSGNYHKWRVRRKVDNFIIASQFKFREEAVKALAEYKKALTINKRDTKFADTDAA